MLMSSGTGAATARPKKAKRTVAVWYFMISKVNKVEGLVWKENK